MEGLREFSCESCKMPFHSVGLLNKHEAKFCIGTDFKDPVALWRGRMGRIEIEQASMKTMRSTRARTPDSIIVSSLIIKSFGTLHLNICRDQMNQPVDQKESPPAKPRDVLLENNTLSKLTEEFQKLRMSIEESLTTRQTEVSFTSSNMYAKQSSFQQRGDEEKALQLSKIHKKRLAEIRAYNQRLEKEREEIDQRLAELAGRDRTAHLEEVLHELRYQEQKNEEVLHQISSHIDSNKGPSPSEVPSNSPVDIKTQHINFDLISSVDGPLSAQIRALRLAYMQSGGSDPEFLAHMHDLQAEALTLEQTKPKADGRAKGRRKSPHRLLDPELLAVEQENQRLEEEIFRIQLARERQKGGLNVIQKDHINHMSSLQAEIAYLKREIEKGRERRPPLTPPTSPLFPHKNTEIIFGLLEGSGNFFLSMQDESFKQPSPTGHYVIDPTETFGPALYDPVAGFVIFYDVVIGMEATIRSVRLLVGLYCNGQKLGQTTPMPPVQCLPSTKSPGNFAILAVKQPVTTRIQPSSNLSLVVEIQASEGLDLYGHENGGLVTRGWAKLELFDQHNQVYSGHWRLPFRSLPVQVSLSPAQLNFVPQIGVTELCVRVVNACEEDVQTIAKVDHNTISQYKYPPMVVLKTPSIQATHEPQQKLQPSSNPVPSSLPQTDNVVSPAMSN
ncbi:coiled-coil domain-containing protein 17 [Triplophysa rosa]|uniref:coiled-coil domain-containing protein 17 n=1 Tax=Triplophysa rosa TaxID=992332 RepID=UPI002545FC78|nr:coiled-coil domain-containing protein 17 [Triplophysa rosa]